MTIKDARNSEAAAVLRDISRAELEEYYGFYKLYSDKDDDKALAWMEKYSLLEDLHERVFGEEADMHRDGTLTFHPIEGVA